MKASSQIGKEDKAAMINFFEPIGQGGRKEAMPSVVRFRTGHATVDGSMVATYKTLELKSQPLKGFRQVHLFRFRGNKIAEYWDVTRHSPENSPYAKYML